MDVIPLIPKSPLSRLWRARARIPHSSFRAPASRFMYLKDDTSVSFRVYIFFPLSLILFLSSWRRSRDGKSRRVPLRSVFTALFFDPATETREWRQIYLRDARKFEKIHSGSICLRDSTRKYRLYTLNRIMDILLFSLLISLIIFLINSLALSQNYFGESTIGNND